MRVAEISLPAIRHNVQHIRELTGGQVIAVIKANGYGHGASFAATAAIEGGATLLGVADLEEALALRDAGITAPIICWLHGAGVDFDAAVEHDIEIGVSHLSQLDSLAQAAHRAGKTANLQFKLDTGLSRNGASPDEWRDLFARGAALETAGQVRVRGIFSHLANAGEAADRQQQQRFDEAIELLLECGIEPEMVHLAASAATFASPHLRYNTVRVGMAIYGLSPMAGKTSADLGLVPAMTLRSEIVALRHISAGTGVSYGYNHVAQSDTTLGLIPFGYADGMPRALNGSGATVTIAGRHCPIVGRIGMDQCIVDLGKLGKKVTVGDPVVLFGDPTSGVPPVELWAEVMGTINYEIVAGIGSRVVRVASERPVATTQKLEVAHPDAMHEFGVRLGRRLVAGDLVVLTGPLGAGKTTLTRGIGEGLEVRGPVTSPTFVLARTHPALGDGPPLIHVDAYRLADAHELEDLDLDFEGSVVVAEWGAGLLDEQGSWVEIVIERPTGAGAGLDADAVTLDMSDGPIEPRRIVVTGYGPRWAGGVL
ncbi:MAG: alanine racemase [Leucobacter sp.]|nr:alanine racemase [Leucobacter sp.]